MAGDWIKMRGALLDHPKVVRIGRELQKNKDFREWLTPGGGGEMNGQLCSDAALRCVTTALLMRVWSIAREHGKFVGDDLVLEHSEIADIDQMAGAPGVGEAMEVVRWALPENGVTLLNFKEFNVPMTNAEKQREYRKRHAQGNGADTQTLPIEGNETRENVTSRVEKRRSKTSPSPSLNGRGRKAETPAPEAFEVTEPMWAWAQGQGVPNERVEPETAKFLDHHKAKGSKFSDWDAAWRTWMRKSVEFSRSH